MSGTAGCCMKRRFFMAAMLFVGRLPYRLELLLAALHKAIPQLANTTPQYVEGKASCAARLNSFLLDSHNFC